MTSPLRRKRPITPPSTRRSTWPNLVPLLAAIVAAGCAFASESAEAQQHRGSRQAAQHQPAPRRTSRFADIAQAKFFEEQPSPAAIPLAPPPTPVAFEASGFNGQVRNAEEPVPAAFGSLHYVEAAGLGDGAANAEFSACRPLKGTIQQVQDIIPGRGLGVEEEYISRPPVNDPRKLKKITEIEPYKSYEPNPQVRAMDPCQNLCPRPDGAPCEDRGPLTPACPEEVVLSNELYTPRCFEESIFAWEASNIYYNPIYFEDVPLERYGHTYPHYIQPFASVGKFSLQLVGLPYQMAIDPPWKCMYPLGYYRPGECAPKLHYQIPWNTRAALVQAGVTTGMFYLIP